MDREEEGVVPGFERVKVANRMTMVGRGEAGHASGPREPERFAAVVRAAKFEVIPLAGIEDAVAAALRPGAVVTITCSPTKGLDPTLEVTGALMARGYVAVPHLAARSVRDAAHLADVIARLDAAGVTRVFVVGGDAPEPGPFSDGLSLLRAMEDAGHRFADVGVPAYPEGHPLISTEALWSALLAKQPHADSMATQLCFDARAIVRWLVEARRRGVTLPVEIGVPGPADLTRLLRVSARIGVADAARYLRKNRGLLGGVLRRRAFRPDPLMRGLEATIEEASSGVQGLHVYTFNQVDAAARWQRQTLDRER
jgi:methylenetetrahydrofolate reductase (NADPH)